VSPHSEVEVLFAEDARRRPDRAPVFAKKKKIYFRYVHAVKDYGTGYVHIKSVEKTMMRPTTDRKYTVKQLLLVGTKRLKDVRNLYQTNV
jgi:hypothetical protein